MSMNLIYRIHNKYYEEFPFRTSTDTTYNVLSKSTKEEQFEIIKECCKEYEVEYLIEEIRDMVFRDEVKLCMI